MQTWESADDMQERAQACRAPSLPQQFAGLLWILWLKGPRKAARTGNTGWGRAGVAVSFTLWM